MVLRIIFILFISGTFLYSDKPISERLRPFEPFLGNRYQGKYSNPQDGRLMDEVQHWERTLNGNAIKMTHTINNGEYGGITIFMFDPEFETLRSWYFDTAGSVKIANINYFNEKIIITEDVTKNRNGITKVKTTLEILDNLMLLKKTKYLMKNLWVDGNEVLYRQTKEFWPFFK